MGFEHMKIGFVTQILHAAMALLLEEIANNVCKFDGNLLEFFLLPTPSAKMKKFQSSLIYVQHGAFLIKFNRKIPTLGWRGGK